MIEITERVFKFRNAEIEHVANPHTGLVPTILWENPADDDRVATCLLSDSTGEIRTTEDPNALLDLVERYLGEMLDFLEAHRNISVLITKRSASFV